MPSHSVHQQID